MENEKAQTHMERGNHYYIKEASGCYLKCLSCSRQFVVFTRPDETFDNMYFCPLCGSRRVYLDNGSHSEEDFARV